MLRHNRKLTILPMLSFRRKKSPLQKFWTLFAFRTTFIHANFRSDNVLLFSLSMVFPKQRFFMRISGKSKIEIFVIDKCKKGFFFHIFFHSFSLSSSSSPNLCLKRPIVLVQWTTSIHTRTQASTKNRWALQQILSFVWNREFLAASVAWVTKKDALLLEWYVCHCCFCYSNFRNMMTTK